ncbi:hypothetical protein STEG23_029022, partial [Scotinomys teguina]
MLLTELSPNIPVVTHFAVSLMCSTVMLGCMSMFQFEFREGRFPGLQQKDLKEILFRTECFKVSLRVS